MFLFDHVTSYLLAICLLTLLVAVLIWQKQRSGRTVSVWAGAAVLGILLGSIASYGAMCWAGYEIVKSVDRASPSTSDGPSTASLTASGAYGPSSGSGGGGGMGGGMMGGMGQGPRSPRELTNLVRKLELLTGDVHIDLSAEQAAKVAESLKGVEQVEELTEEDASARNEAILAALTDEQKAQLEMIGLPRPPRSPSMGSPGGPPPEPAANPFTQETEGKSLETLRNRLVGETAPDATAEKAAPAEEKPAEEKAEEAASPPADEQPAATEEKPAEDMPAANEEPPATTEEKPADAEEKPADAEEKPAEEKPAE